MSGKAAERKARRRRAPQALILFGLLRTTAKNRSGYSVFFVTVPSSAAPNTSCWAWVPPLGDYRERPHLRNSGKVDRYLYLLKK